LGNRIKTVTAGSDINLLVYNAGSSVYPPCSGKEAEEDEEEDAKTKEDEEEDAKTKRTKKMKRRMRSSSQTPLKLPSD
jgi:hypothetical protein